MKKRNFVFFIMVILFIWGSNVYASHLDNKSLASTITTHKFSFRVDLQFLPLHLVFPNLDVRDESNQPIKNYKGLSLNRALHQYEIFTVLGVIRKKKGFEDVRLQTTQSHKSQSINTRKLCINHQKSAFCLSKEENLSLRFETLLC